MSDDHAPFLAAIIAAPDDDRPREIFADWLEENGEPLRAELIRLQIKLATQHIDPKCEKGKWPKTCWCLREMVAETYWCDPCKKWQALHERERKIIREHSYPWVPEAVVKVVANSTSHGWGWKRGFVEWIHIGWESLFANHKAIRAATPLSEALLLSWQGWGTYHASDGKPFVVNDHDGAKEFFTHEFKGLRVHLPAVFNRANRGASVGMALPF